MQFQRLRRREFIILFGGTAVVALPMGVQAQQSRHIAVLSQGSIHTHPTPVFRAFLDGLRESGWIVGQNLSIDWRFSEGSAGPLGRLAAELVDRQVEVIVTSPTEPTIAAKRATSNIPIVFVGVADPIQAGIVTNLARPDANVTGMSTVSTDIAGKRLALLKEALPSATRISILWNRPSKGAALILHEMQAACKKLGIEPQDIGVSEHTEIDHALDSAVSNRSAAIVVIDDLSCRDMWKRLRKLLLCESYRSFRNTRNL
jgi:putative ABC transport system substrate-binding protein